MPLLDLSVKPSLTLALCCYKFERFVTEAVEGAFAQTYRPLEIVISDDHSPDATWARIVEAVMRIGGIGATGDAWQKPDFCGTVELTVRENLHLVLNRNEKNLGLAFHENKLFELSHGEWIAFQAGDDISMPNRMSRIAEIVSANGNVRCIHCAVDHIDAEGKPLSVPGEKLRMHSNRQRMSLPIILGAGAVYHHDVYSLFGPIGNLARNEDHVLPLRSLLLGDIVRIEDELVRYRKHDANESGNYFVTNDIAARYRLRIIPTLYQELMDLHVAEQGGLAPASVIERYRRLVNDEIALQHFLGNWQLHPEMHGILLWGLMTSPHRFLLFVRRALRRFFR